jgi:hypothetical protein
VSKGKASSSLLIPCRRLPLQRESAQRVPSRSGTARLFGGLGDSRAPRKVHPEAPCAAFGAKRAVSGADRWNGACMCAHFLHLAETEKYATIERLAPGAPSARKPSCHEAR